MRETAAVEFRTELQAWLRQETEERSLAVVTTAHRQVTPKAVFDRVAERWQRIEGLLQPTLGGWEKARDRLAEAEAGVERRMPLAKLKQSVVISFVLTVVALAVLLWLGTALSTDFFVLWFVVLFPPIPGLNAWGERRLARSELAVEIRRKELEKAKARFDVNLRDQIKIAVREVVHEMVASFQIQFRIFDRSGLRELADREREVPTRSSTALGRLLNSLASGSIGLAGPRGSGKTTLIDSFAQGRSLPFEKERIGLVVSAPVKYDARDFILHLFASLCKRVLGEDNLEEITRLNWQALARQRRVALARFGLVAGLLLGAAGGLMLLTGQTAPREPEETGTFLVLLGALTAYVALLTLLRIDRKLTRRVAGVFSSSQEGEKPERETSPEKRAQERLEEIQFQQSVSAGWSGGLKLPLGMSLGADSSRTLSRTPWTFPEAVEEFRSFASSEFEDRYVVIGIDELDKMESDEAAREFLNDVKGVFGVRNCYYLVSVSEEAMSTFERRGLPFRDVFDSSFDAMEQVEFLTLGESRAVLESRVTGLPIPFQCLCHTLSGGLPRDLIRVTRSLVQLSGSAEEEKGRQLGPPASLGALAIKLAQDEHRRKLTAAIAGIRNLKGRDIDWLAPWLDSQKGGAASSSELRRWSSELADLRGMPAGLDEGDQALRAWKIAMETALFNYYGAAVIDLYGAADIDLLVRRSISQNEGSPIERLAIARQQFSISPRLAWSTIDVVRRAIGAEPWKFPSPRRRHRWRLRRA